MESNQMFRKTEGRLSKRSASPIGFLLCLNCPCLLFFIYSCRKHWRQKRHHCRHHHHYQIHSDGLLMPNRRRDHHHCCGSETRVDDVILLHCSLFLALLTQSAIVIPVHSFTSSTHRLLGLPRALFPSTYPWHMNAGNLSALIMCPK